MHNEGDRSIAEFTPLTLLLSYRSTIFISALSLQNVWTKLYKFLWAILLIQVNVEYSFSSSRQNSERTG